MVNNPGWCSTAFFFFFSTTPSAQGAQRHHAEGALAFFPLPITSFQSQLDLSKKDLLSERKQSRENLEKIVAREMDYVGQSEASVLPTLLGSWMTLI